MEKLKALQDERKKVLGEATAIRDKRKAEDREDYTEAESKSFDERLARVDAIDAEIDQLEQRRKGDERLDAAIGRTNEPEERTVPPQPVRTGPTAPPVKVPAVARYHPGRLTAYTAERCGRILPGSDPREMAYRSGRWFAACVAGDPLSQRWCADQGMEMRASQLSGVNTLGGYFVIPELEMMIIDLRLEYGVWRRETNVVPMLSDTKNQPRSVSGLDTYFVGEVEAPTESEMTWDMISLKARTLAALGRYSLELGEDSFVNMGEQFAKEMAWAFAKKEDESGFLGDGTSTYGGIFGLASKIADGNHAGSIYDAISGNTAFSTLDREDFEAMVGKLPSFAEANAKWYIHKAGWAASILNLQNAAGGNTKVDLGSGPVNQFLGYPIVFSEVLNSTLTAQASTIILFFGDLRLASTMGDRRGLTIESSREKYFTERQVAVMGTERFDINVHELGGSSTAGPILALKTPAS